MLAYKSLGISNLSQAGLFVFVFFFFPVLVVAKLFFNNEL